MGSYDGLSGKDERAKNQGGPLHFRRAVEKDERLLLEWRNEAEAREQSFQSHEITKEEHHRWFQGILGQPDATILIFLLGEVPVGNVRFNCNGLQARISYSIDCKYRGQGLGRKMIEMAGSFAKSELGLTKLIAETKIENLSSQHVLLSNGFFEKEKMADGAGIRYIKNMERSRPICFRVDGNPKIGSGHVMRCLSLADVFQDLGHMSCFVTASRDMQNLIEDRGYACHVLHTEYDHMEQELDVFLPLLKEKQPELLVLDSYFVTPAYMHALKQEVLLVYIDDMNAFDYPADVVVNYNIYAEDMEYPPGKKYLLGPRYAPLRREFQNIPKKEIWQDVKDILLLTGGTDLEHVVLTLLRYLQENPLPEGIALHAVLGAMNQDAEEIERAAQGFLNVKLYRNITNISELMQECDIAISAAGTTLYELCACGIPTVTYILADNQIVSARSFERAGLMLCAGDVRTDVGFAGGIFSKVDRLVHDMDLRGQMAQKMQHMGDGNGTKHLAKKLCDMQEGGWIK